VDQCCDGEERYEHHCSGSGGVIVVEDISSPGHF
jgi:hypothetical protein